MRQYRVTERVFRAFRPYLLGALALAAGSFATAASACPDWAQTGQVLNYTSDQLYSPRTHSVVAGGSNNLANCPQPGGGYVATRPDFDLNFSGNGMGRDLEIRVNASCDSVLLVNDARGQWYFDDDGGDGLNSRLRIANAPNGTYDIWVGTYGPSTCQATMTLETFNAGGPPPPLPPQQPAACPNPAANGQMLTFNGQDLWQPQRFNVVAGGNIDLGACQAVPGHGHIVQSPDFTLNFTANPRNYDLEFRVEASCDPVLLVNSPTGQWFFNDDDNGLNSRVRIPGAMAGQYDIWVGTFGSQTCQATLIAETFGGQVTPPPPPPSFCPDPSIPTNEHIYSAAQLASAQNFNDIAGGNVDLGACQTVSGHGHITQRANHTFILTDNPRSGNLEFRVNSSCDPVLLVYGPNGQWHYNDDSNGLNPRLTITGAAPGAYDVWVGTFGSQTCAVTLEAQMTGVAPPQPPQPNVLPDPGNLTSYRNRVGQTFSFQVTGAGQGSVWGTGVYTDDSSLARAAVHAGVLQVGQSGVVQVTILPGQQTYQGSTQNGVQSSAYGSWSGSYSFVQQGVVVPPPGGIASRLLAVQTSAGRDFVGRGDGMTPNNSADGLYRIGVSAPGQVVTGIEVRNTDGIYSVWDTQPNGFWSAAVVVNGQLMNQANGTVNFVLGQGETVLDLYVENNGAIGNAGMAITVSFASGQQTVVTVPSGFVGGSTPGPQPGQSRYQLVVVPEGITFDAARQRAEAMGGHLATIGSMAENQAVFAAADNPAAWYLESGRYNLGPWLGGLRQGTGWMWVTGEPWSYTAWAGGQPDNYAGRESHLHFWVNGDRREPTWNDIPPTTPMRGFVVEFEASGQNPGPIPGQNPAADGQWRINANGWAGTLDLDWTGNGWSGTVTFDAYGQQEMLQDVTFNSGTGAITFTRPIQGATQMYRGVLTNGQLSGQFNQNGGGYDFNWSATRSGPQPQPSPMPQPGK